MNVLGDYIAYMYKFYKCKTNFFDTYINVDIYLFCFESNIS